MSVAPLLLFLPVLCLVHSVHPRSPPPACPEHMCVCSAGEGSKGAGQQREADCKELPTERLTKTITALRVSGQVTKITKKMIATLGGDLLSLDLSDCELQTVEPGSFDAAPKLVTLRLSNNRIEEIGPGTFKKNKALRELYLDGNRLKHVDESAFSKLEQLRVLRLEGNYLTQFPSKIPIGLTVLNVSHNNIGPELGCEIHETNLKELDLCGNHVERLANTTLRALNKLQRLCVGDAAVRLPENAARYLPHLSDLSLVATTGGRAGLDALTRTELAGMGTLTSLEIVNYKLESLSFLHSLTKLRRLSLRDVTTPEPVDFQSILLSQTSLATLDLAGSHDLAHSLLDKMQVLGALGALQTVILRNASVTHLASSDVPRTDGFRLDISGNPLRCDCAFAWIKGRRRNDTARRRFLLNADETKCAAPVDCVGKRLTDVVDALECPDEDRREIRDSYQGGGRPVAFPDRPTHLPIGREETQLRPHHGTWGRPTVKFPDSHKGGSDHGHAHPDQGNESEFPPLTEQGNESEFPTLTEQGNESEFPTHTGQGSESESSDGGYIETSGDPDRTESGTTTIEPAATGQPGHSQDEDNQTLQPDGEGTDTTTDVGHDGMPEHMSVHEADTSDYGVVYIVLGTLLGLLVLVGLILGAFYWHFKKTGGNKITPASGMPSTTNQTPAEPSFQQLQQTEGSSLLKNVKK